MSRRGLVRGLVVTGGVLVVAAVAVAWGLAHLGHWLVVEDRLERAEAIVVLGGGFPFRAVEGASLYAAGWAPEVWLLRSAAPAREAALARLGLAAISEDVGSRSILERLGVPASAIRVLDGRARNTVEEMRVVAARLGERVDRPVILITSKPHTRRVRIAWGQVTGSRVRILVRAARDEPFDADHWWRTSGDALAVSREALGLLNAWAGFPVRPGGRL